MNIHWSLPVALPVEGGVLRVVTGYLECEPGAGFDGELVTTLARREITRVAGANRAAWGDLSYRYVRHCMGVVDVLVVSVAVVVTAVNGGAILAAAADG